MTVTAFIALLALIIVFLMGVEYFHRRQKRKPLWRLRPKPGQSLFSFNVETGAIHNMGKPRAVVLDNRLIYMPAVNYKSFVRKLKREGYIKPEAHISRVHDVIVIDS